jgi:hypothetical protein
MVAQASACDFGLYILGLHWTDPYQGTTSVVPIITARTKGFSPCPSATIQSRAGTVPTVAEIYRAPF